MIKLLLLELKNRNRKKTKIQFGNLNVRDTIRSIPSKTKEEDPPSKTSGKKGLTSSSPQEEEEEGKRRQTSSYLPPFFFSFPLLSKTSSASRPGTRKGGTLSSEWSESWIGWEKGRRKKGEDKRKGGRERPFRRGQSESKSCRAATGVEQLLAQPRPAATSEAVASHHWPKASQAIAGEATRSDRPERRF